jgi:glucose/arabinose dehydrogenase
MNHRPGPGLIGWTLVVACATPLPAPTSATPTTVPATVATTSAPTSTTLPPSTTLAPTTTIPPTTATTEPPPPLEGLALEPVASGLAQPTVVTSPSDDGRLFIVERTGVIRLVDEHGALAAQPYLDISDHVTSGGIEQGMLGLAFHPQFSVNGRFYVYYVNEAGQRTLSEVTASAEASADPATERVLFSLPQPPGSVDIRHYGGMLMFGPDGYLYVSLGDGADARGQGQDPGTVFGSVLRLDIDDGDPYAIPSDNPFANGGGAPEVWLFGLRNPWRFTIDAVDGLVYVADVGQETWEEINVVPLDGGGANFGWPDSEGNHCFLDSGCDLSAFTTPILEYGHDEGCSITGGHVYRGDAIPELAGHYFYGDWCGGWVRSFRYADGAVTDEQDWSQDLAGVGQPNGFGLDASGELYVASYGGDVFKIVPVRSNG